MRTRIAGLVAVVAVAALLPIAPAAAAVVGKARLADGAVGFPKTRTLRVSVTNDALAVVGAPLRWVRIVLPTTAAGVAVVGTPSGPAGFSGVTSAEAGDHVVTFTAGGSTGIGAGQMSSFDLPVDVAAPLDSDRVAPVVVEASENADGSQKARLNEASSGALDVTVRVLQGISLAPVAPALAADGNGTAGQEVVFRSCVRNLAQQTINVNHVVYSWDDLTTNGLTKPAAGGGVQTCSDVPLVLGPRQSGQDTRTYEAEIRGVSGPMVSPGTPPPPIQYTVQAPTRLTLTASSFQPTSLRTGVAYDFSVQASTSGPSTVVVSAGTLDLRASADGYAAGTTDLGAPVTVASGSPQQLVFPADAFPSTLTPGRYDAVLELSATDGNGHPLAAADLTRTFEAAVAIDEFGPPVTVTAVIPYGQTHVKNGDTVAVSAEASDCTIALTVRLHPDAGPPIDVPLSRTCAGSMARVSGTASPTFVTGARSFRLISTAVGAGGATSTGISASIGIDNTPPTLVGEKGAVFFHPAFGNGMVVRVDPVEDSLLRGGCDPLAWRVDGEPFAQQVYYSNGALCVLGAEPPPGVTNARILRPLIDASGAAAVTYCPRHVAVDCVNRDPITDGVGWSMPNGSFQELEPE